jgi:hypothetical protein
MQNNTKGGTITLRVMCAILFLLFVVFYVYLFQCDLLAMMQYAWSGGLKHYERNIGTIVITLVLLIITTTTSTITRLPIRCYALNYYPALLSLSLLTTTQIDGSTVSISKTWLVVTIILFILYVAWVHKLSKYKVFMQPLRAYSLFSHPWWTNLSLLFIGFSMVYIIGNTDRTLHTRLAVERLCSQKNYNEALQVGIPQYDNDSSLVMLRALALANQIKEDSTCQLGEKLFQYEITPTSRALFPQTDKSCGFLMENGLTLWKTLGFVPYDLKEEPATILKREIQREENRLTLYNDTTLAQEERDLYKRTLCTPVCHDYLLCSYLIDKKLKEFIKELPRFYTINDKMPQHYREACILYENLYGGKLYKDTPVEADYNDFLSVMRNNRNETIRYAALRDSYFGTYWYYYFTH